MFVDAALYMRDVWLKNLPEIRQAIYEYEAKAVEEHGLENYLQHIVLFTAMERAADDDK